jgi:hypothetical protein
MKTRQLFLITASFVFGLLFIPVPVANAENETFFVAVNGNDLWSGHLPAPNPDRTDGPFATLHAACSAARKVKDGQPRKVVIQNGQYFLDRTLELDAGDAGLSIESSPGADVCLYGGKKSPAGKKTATNSIRLHYPASKKENGNFVL